MLLFLTLVSSLSDKSCLIILFYSILIHSNQNLLQKYACQPQRIQYLSTLWTLCRFLSGPTDVKMSILIRSMGPISDVDMHYSMDCYFRQYWRDTRLSFKGLKMTSNQLHINQLSLNVKMLEKIWKPDTYFHNGLDSYLHTITRPNKLFRISENGDITYSMR